MTHFALAMMVFLSMVALLAALAALVETRPLPQLRALGLVALSVAVQLLLLGAAQLALVQLVFGGFFALGIVAVGLHRLRLVQFSHLRSGLLLLGASISASISASINASINASIRGQLVAPKKPHG